MLVIAAAVVVFVAGFVIGSSVVAKLVSTRADATEPVQAEHGHEQEASERPGAAAGPRAKAADDSRDY